MKPNMIAFGRTDKPRIVKRGDAWVCYRPDNLFIIGMGDSIKSSYDKYIELFNIINSGYCS